MKGTKKQVRIDPELLQEVKIESAKRGMSMGEFVSEAIRKFIKK